VQNATATAWILLGIAIVGELIGTLSLKGASKNPWLWASVVGGYASALILLNSVIQQVDIGVAYAIWSGVSIVLAVACGAVFFGERLTWQRVAGFCAITLGVVLIQLEGKL